MSSAPNESASGPPDTANQLPSSAPAPTSSVRKRSRAIAWGSGVFLALGVGIPVAFALQDWRPGLILGLLIGLLTVVGYLKAGSDHAEQRADRIADQYSREDADDEDDDGSYS